MEMPKHDVGLRLTDDFGQPLQRSLLDALHRLQFEQQLLGGLISNPLDVGQLGVLPLPAVR